jgi:hypothetical protein
MFSSYLRLDRPNAVVQHLTEHQNKYFVKLCVFTILDLLYLKIMFSAFMDEKKGVILLQYSER